MQGKFTGPECFCTIRICEKMHCSHCVHIADKKAFYNDTEKPKGGFVMRKLFSKKVLGYIALALVCTLRAALKRRKRLW